MALDGEPRRTAIQRTHRVLLVLLGVLFVLLVGTGVWLALRYQPTAGFRTARPESWIRSTHRTASRLFVFAALATFGFSIAMSIERALKRGMPAWVVGLLVMLGALAASLSGHLLPWDQLALAPVRASEYRGYAFLFGHPEVRFVLVTSVEVGKATVQRWFFAHTVVLPLALLGVGVVAWRLTRRGRLAPSATAGDGEP
ncbi:MAG: cytochrome b N-terminal domain-containing protein [Acidimicrobiia bacterium]|nr:cytochrome b N-terminal domain-containing protein [Acidimicrobiia bacterium]